MVRLVALLIHRFFLVSNLPSRAASRKGPRTCTATIGAPGSGARNGSGHGDRPLRRQAPGLEQLQGFLHQLISNPFSNIGIAKFVFGLRRDCIADRLLKCLNVVNLCSRTSDMLLPHTVMDCALSC